MIACICGFSIEAILIVCVVGLSIAIDKLVCWCKICNGGLKRCKSKKWKIM